jgi:hypothetical protein
MRRRGPYEAGSALRASSTRYAGAIRTWRSTPKLRYPAPLIEDDDEDDYEAPGEGERCLDGGFVFLRLRSPSKNRSTAPFLLRHPELWQTGRGRNRSSAGLFRSAYGASPWRLSWVAASLPKLNVELPGLLVEPM